MFVHGLKSHPYRAFGEPTHPNPSLKEEPTAGLTFWPQDLLGKDLPEARIFSWGYDTNWNGCWEGGIVEQAESLLKDLTDSFIGRPESVSKKFHFD